MAVSFDLFMNFNGNCREAVDFYAKVFKSEVEGLMTYGDMPPDPSFIVPDSKRDLIMYACVPIYGSRVMFCDYINDEVIVGNNICPTIGTGDADEIRRLYMELQAGGSVGTELQQTFWSDLYGMVTDKYGIIWQLSHEKG